MSGEISVGPLIAVVRDAGVIGLLVFIVIGNLREWWVSGRQYRRILRERDAFQSELFRVLGLTERATHVLDRATTRVLGNIGDDPRLSRIQAERDIRSGIDEDDDRDA